MVKKRISHRSQASKGIVAETYFSKFFIASNTQFPVDFFDGFQRRVTDTMNESLSAEVTPEEIKRVVFSIKPSSAPGADNMTGLFFQKYWPTIGDAFTTEVLSFFSLGKLPSEWNFTQLCLIRKKPKASSMSDLRPISLCAVMYKAISKILVSRLQPFLAENVSLNQSTFLLERLILDNILLAHEAIHALRTYPLVLSQFLALKTDMSKAFDRMEWCYLQGLLTTMGFDKKWVD